VIAPLKKRERLFMGRSITELAEKEYVVLDGGMGTLLQARGLGPSELPEEWNILHPDVVKGIHLDYLTAGAQIIETNTFGGSSVKLHAKGKEYLVKELNTSGAMLAIEALKGYLSAQGAKADERYVAGSVGPTGKIFEMGMTIDEAKNTFSQQGALLAEAGVDLFIVETMLDIREAEIAVTTLKKETALPVFASVVFNRTAKGEYRTLFGNGVSESVNRLIDAGAEAIGTNCGLIEEYIQVVREMRKLTSVPLLLYPNAGLPVLQNGKTIFNQTPRYMISYIDESIEAGATIIGGCCGTTPEYIRLIAERIRGRMVSNMS
jgi:5-methyltetrahydrofolate--homocysteine methyltransferase